MRGAIEKEIKRCFKRRVGITSSLIILFLITGSLAYSSSHKKGDTTIALIPITTPPTSVNLVDNIIVPEQEKNINEQTIGGISLKTQNNINSDVIKNGDFLVNVGQIGTVDSEIITNEVLSINLFEVKKVPIVAVDAGMYGSGKNFGVINNGILNHKGDYGLYVENGAQGINNKTIQNTGNYGMYGKDKGTYLRNAQKKIIQNKGDYGMFVELGAGAVNEGTIKNSGDFGMYGTDKDTFIRNTINGTIENDGDYGIYLLNSLGGINTGTVKNNGNFGIYIDGTNSYFTNNISGKIINQGDYGIFAVDGAGVVNEGLVSNDKNFGIYGRGAGVFIRNTSSGTISNGGDYGIYVEDEAGAINEGIISNSGNYGMYGKGPWVFIRNTGEISTKGNYSMFAENGAGAINNGVINITGNGNIGMYAKDGSTAINESTGKIFLNGNNGIGMVADGNGSFIVNKGIIYLKGMEINGIGDITTVDSNGNKAMELRNGGAFYNASLFTVTGHLNSNLLGDGTGSFIIGGGTVKADSISGDYYASGALTVGGYENVYNTYQVFQTPDMYGNLYSYSAMFDAKLTVSNSQDPQGDYGIEMVRKDFRDIMGDTEIARYLENNYTEEGNTEAKEALYDAYKLIRTPSELNSAGNTTFGKGIYPGFMYQTLSSIRGINEDIKNNTLKEGSLEDFRYIGFGNFKRSDVELGSNLTDYDLDMKSVTLGFDKKFTPLLRGGILGTVAKADYDYNNDDSRNDDIYQVNFITSYEKNSFKWSATAYLGKTKGDLERVVAIFPIYEKQTGDIENNYYGIDLAVEKNYTIKSYNLIPKLELNTTHVTQKGINENGTYGLTSDSIESTSVESGIGGTIERVFISEKRIKIIPNFTAMYYNELGTPYKDTNVALNYDSNDKVVLDGYNARRDRVILSLGMKLERESLNLIFGIGYKMDSETDETTPFVGVGYKL